VAARATRVAVVLAVAAAGAFAAGLFALGIVGWQRHTGYFAPVWDASGQRVYWLERETRGFVWGLGWEHFTPPAHSYVYADGLTLRELDTRTGAIRDLEEFRGSPIEGRVGEHYRGRIFSTLSARLRPAPEGVEILAVMSIPRIPSSERWSLVGTWRPGSPSNAQWSQEFGGTPSRDEAVLHDGVELIPIPGAESFPCAVAAVDAAGGARILIRNDRFEDLYPEGVPPAKLAEWSSRESIERVREFRHVNSELVAGFRAQGMPDGEARLRAYDEMEERGYLPKSPRLVATRVAAAPPDAEVFEIPEEYFRVGLFQDIAAAIASPGSEVDTGTGTYLKYYDDELGPRLREHREAGTDRFAVRTGDAIWLLQVRRFDR